MPSPSYLPLVAALGLAVAAYGLIYYFPASVVGAGITMVGVYGWAMEPATEPNTEPAE